MSEDLHGIDKLFQESIEGHAEAPPPFVWEQLDKKLDQIKVASIAVRYNKLKWVAAALFLLSLSLSAMWVYHLKRDQRASGLVKKDSSRQASGRSLRQSKPAPIQLPATATQPGLAPVQPADKDSLQNQETALETPGDINHIRKEMAPLPSQVAETSAGTKKNLSARKEIQLKPRAQASTAAGNRQAPERTNSRQQGLAERSKNNGKESKAQADITQGSGLQEENTHPDKNTGHAAAEEVALRRMLVAEPVLLADHAPVDASKLPLLAYRSLVPDQVQAAAPAPVHLTPVQAGGFTATFFYSPNLVSTSVVNDGSYRIPRGWEDDKKEIKDKEQTRTSKSFGALFDYHITPQWSIGSGLVFSSRITDIQAKTIVARPDPRGGEIKYKFSCSAGYFYINLKPGGNNPPDSDTAKALSATNKMEYVSVPLIAKYSFGQGKFQFVTGAGLQVNFLTSRIIETNIRKGPFREFARTSEIQGLRPVYLSGILSAGVSYRINRILSASAMPTTQLGFMSINKQAPVKSFINYYGVALGLSVKL